MWQHLIHLPNIPFKTGGHVVRKKIYITKADRFKTTPTYQSPTAEEDHENDERFKPVVLHDDEAGFPECPPALVICSLLIDLAALEPAHTACKHEGNVITPHHLATQTQLAQFLNYWAFVIQWDLL